MKDLAFFSAGILFIVSGAQHDTWAEIIGGILLMLGALW